MWLPNVNIYNRDIRYTKHNSLGTKGTPQHTNINILLPFTGENYIFMQKTPVRTWHWLHTGNLSRACNV